MSPAPVTVGGQAVIEGVMMRGPHGYAVAVRRANGSIECESKPYVPLSKRYPVLGLPVVRGAVGLIEMMVIGMKTLTWSGERAALDDPEFNSDKKKNEAPSHQHLGAEEAAALASTGLPGAVVPVPHGKKADEASPLPKAALALTMVISIGFGLFLFVVLPNLAAHFIGKLGVGASTTASGAAGPLLEEQRPILYNLISGAVRLVLIVGYIYLISLMKDVQRLFRYHGAEHKAVRALEAGRDLTVPNVRPMEKLHPRCGTTFIAITLIVAIVVFAFFAKLLIWVYPGFALLGFPLRKTILIFGHILIMPIVAGVCFELLRLGGKYPRNPLLLVFLTPGYWFQRLTVKDPDDSMIEVAIQALNSAMAIAAPAAEAVRVKGRAATESALPAPARLMVPVPVTHSAE